MSIAVAQVLEGVPDASDLRLVEADGRRVVMVGARALFAFDAGDLGMPAWVGMLRVHQGRPAEALAALEPVLGREVAGVRQAFWVEHTLQMTAHAYGLVGRPQEALRVLDRMFRPHGYNIGLNQGRSAGAGLPGHLHWHIVPRWDGDTNFMPVLGQTKVLVESLHEFYDRFQAALAEPDVTHP